MKVLGWLFRCVERVVRQFVEPCPICGSKPEVAFFKRDYTIFAHEPDQALYRCRILCRACGIKTIPEPVSTLRLAIHESLSAWNSADGRDEAQRSYAQNADILDTKAIPANVELAPGIVCYKPYARAMAEKIKAIIAK